jgi:hypothetical protein
MRRALERDAEKNHANRAKHGISLEEASAIFDGPLFTAPDDREDYGEERFISIGHLGGLTVVVAVHTNRNGRIRLISARKANRKETQAYYEHLEETA